MRRSQDVDHGLPARCLGAGHLRAARACTLLLFRQAASVHCSAVQELLPAALKATLRRDALLSISQLNSKLACADPATPRSHRTECHCACCTAATILPL